MANICMDTVVFYTEDRASSENLQKMQEAIKTCYPTGRHCTENDISMLFSYLGIPVENLYLRGDVNYYTFGNFFVELACDSAWRPMADAYDALSRHFGLKVVYMSEEPGLSIYCNTDSDGLFLKTHYKVVLSDRPKDGSLDKLFDAAGEDRDFYFTRESEVLEWLRENGDIQADSIQELLNIVDTDYIDVHEYECP